MISLRFIPTWRRNALVWRKPAGPSILGNLADPIIGLCFGALALVVTSLAPSYDFFMYYFTLVITPMIMLCGVFFPTERLPEAFQIAANFLPLTHATLLVRPLLLGSAPQDVALHVAVLAIYAAAGFALALTLFRGRLAR